MPQFVPYRDERLHYPFRQNVTLRILSGESVCKSYVDLEGCWTVVGVYMPAAWTAAGLPFMTVYPLVTGAEDPTVPVTGAVWQVINEPDSVDEFELTVAAGEYTYIDPGKLAGCRYLKIRSASQGAGVPQDATRAVILVIRPV